MENPQMYPQIRNGSVKECEVDMVAWILRARIGRVGLFGN